MLNKQEAIEMLKNDEFYSIEHILDNVSHGVFCDLEFMKEAVIQFPEIYSYIAPNLYDNKELALLAVTGDAETYSHLHDKLKLDKELLKIAIKENGKHIKKYFAKTKQKISDRELIIIAGKTYDNILKFASEDILKDKEFIMSLMKDSDINIKHIDDSIKNDIDFAEHALSSNGTRLKYLPQWQNNEKMVKLAIKDNAYALQYADRRFFKNKKFVLLAVKEFPLILESINISEWFQDVDIMSVACTQNPTLLSRINLQSPLINNSDFVSLIHDKQKEILKIFEDSKNKQLSIEEKYLLSAYQRQIIYINRFLNLAWNRK